VTQQRIVLLGTGTGIGKTHVGVALVSTLREAGVAVAGLKPVESGVGEGVSDTERLAEAGAFHVKQPPPYALAAPISPHLAADREGLTIHLEPIVRWVDSVEAACIVVETAGAVLSPLASGTTNLDLAVALEPTAVVLVAPDRLGVLHDVTAALFAMGHLAPWLPEPVVALVEPEVADASTGSNARELLVLEIARRVVMFPRAEVGGVVTGDRARALLEMLGNDVGP
jgi:dethiobiotin synthetase